MADHLHTSALQCSVCPHPKAARVAGRSPRYRLIARRAPDLTCGVCPLSRQKSSSRAREGVNVGAKLAHGRQEARRCGKSYRPRSISCSIATSGGGQIPRRLPMNGNSGESRAIYCLNKKIRTLTIPGLHVRLTLFWRYGSLVVRFKRQLYVSSPEARTKPGSHTAVQKVLMFRKSETHVPSDTLPLNCREIPHSAWA